MFNGSVTFVAEIKVNGLTFPSVDITSPVAEIDRITLVGVGQRINCTVHLQNVASDLEGHRIAAEALTAALDRLSFSQRISIENAYMTGSQFVPVVQGHGVHSAAGMLGLHLQGVAGVVKGVPAATVKNDLEVAAPPGERNYRLFRAALQSSSAVEKFMHLYNILMMLFGDRQPAIDVFIVAEEPGVAQSPQPHRPAVIETIYTRLRNELGHPRPGVNLNQTKQEMDTHVGKLEELTKIAIAQHP